MDIELSIAALDFSAGEPDLVALRDRHPELYFVFDYIETLREENEALELELRNSNEDAARALHNQEEASDTRIQELRQALLSVAELALDLSEATTSSDDKYDIVSVVNEIVKVNT